MKRRIFLLLTFAYVTLCLSAQSLVFHLPDGGMSTVNLPATFTISPSDDKLIIESGDNRVELDKNRILAMIYRGAKGDVNDDMTIDVADIATVIDIMAGMGSDTEPDTPEVKPYTSCPDVHHPHLIDLGLPSGTKWACCNVGASMPEDYGNYYAWGETSGKNYYGVSNYQYAYQNDNGLLYDEKTGRNYLITDIGSDIAGTKYDTATANWGPFWKMPSSEQCNELLHNTTTIWTTQNGINGLKLTGTNGGTIFLPAAGMTSDGEFYYVGSGGQFWSSTKDSDITVMELYFLGEDRVVLSNNRYRGLSIRPVH